MTAVLDRPREDEVVPAHAPGTSPARRRVAWAGALVALVLVVGLAAVASFPTGSPSPEGVVPSGGRVAATGRVGSARVLLAVESGDLVLRVAYKGEKGWHGVAAEPVDGDSPAAWSSTDGEGKVPALSSVYGRPRGARVRVLWSDGKRDEVDLALDGAYLIARAGRVAVDRVVVLDADGATVLEVTEL
jgi:hypothetical protein